MTDEAALETLFTELEAALRDKNRDRAFELERPRNDTPPRHAAGTPSSRASTSFLRAFSGKGVDGRDKPRP
jgi:hypothetical protein